ncbi:DUF4012 domain-containing protein [Microbispora sp. ATCC PTA-5024]|uniref:DUF4012 domain-containing protein n=1 Tax=Microbispora sp. ATCC PTA-5024 TaxID=316330 RepID=UPI0003DC05C7|nr:DUF4012 domain-containing protein [Microbispora sp. ATCC PTA-5024]ETK33476.1 hypothetical protein MPTA5024_24350 [Microbispora sp. ATCC PTA-5024]
MGDLRSTLSAAATAAAVLPPMLGLDGTRRYFLAFQTNAEARGTGGLVGAFGVLKADRGRLSVTGLSADNGLGLNPRPVADFGTAYRERYGPDALRLLSISNLSPHFPYAARTGRGCGSGRRAGGWTARWPSTRWACRGCWR